MNYVILKTTDDMRDAFVGACLKAEEITGVIMNHIKSNIHEGYPQSYVVVNIKTGITKAYEPNVTIDLKEV